MRGRVRVDWPKVTIFVVVLTLATVLAIAGIVSGTFVEWALISVLMYALGNGALAWQGKHPVPLIGPAEVDEEDGRP